MIKSPVIFASSEKVAFARTIADGFVHGKGRVVDAGDIMRTQYPYEQFWSESEGRSHVVIATSVHDPDLLRRAPVASHEVEMDGFNKMLPVWLSMIARDRGVPAVFLSSVWVFGQQKHAGCETTPKPETYFGRSLRIAERVVMRMSRTTPIRRRIGSCRARRRRTASRLWVTTTG